MYRKIKRYKKLIMHIWNIKIFPLSLKYLLILFIIDHIEHIYGKYLGNRHNNDPYEYYKDFCDFRLDVLEEYPYIEDDKKDSFIVEYANGGIYIFYTVSCTFISREIIIRNNYIEYTKYERGIIACNEKYYGKRIDSEWCGSYVDKLTTEKMIIFLEDYIYYDIKLASK